MPTDEEIQAWCKLVYAEMVQRAQASLMGACNVALPVYWLNDPQHATMYNLGHVVLFKHDSYEDFYQDVKQKVDYANGNI